jgi:protein ImuA
MDAIRKSEIVHALQDKILALEGFKAASNPAVDYALSPIRAAFPNGVFPLGAVHEFVCTGSESKASTSGFISGLLSALMARGGVTLWISSSRILFPPALKAFGLQPDRFVFIDAKRDKDVTWAVDESLKCDALTAVVGEMQNIDFTTSRRLQLAVEQSKATGFIITTSSKMNANACVARWRISPLPSEPIDNLPGVGLPKWNVELLKIRNGKPGNWQLQWDTERFQLADHVLPFAELNNQKKAG